MSIKTSGFDPRSARARQIVATPRIGLGESVEQLADAADVHVNTARAHVAALEDAGAIVSRLRERPGRGRQGIEYALQEGWSLAPEDFLAVAAVLAAAIIRAGTPSEKLLALAAIGAATWWAGRVPTNPRPK